MKGLLIYLLIYLAYGFWIFRCIKKEGLSFSNSILLIGFLVATGWLFVFINDAF